MTTSSLLQVKTRYSYHTNGMKAPAGWIFVFGSNLAGAHGAGAALEARKTYGARMGVGFGQEAMSYAIPTKDEKITTLPLKRIEAYANMAIKQIIHRIDTVHEKYWFTAVGCGLAGYNHAEIAPLFRSFEAFIPENRDIADHLSFPDEWFEYLEPQLHHEHTLKALLFTGDHQTMTPSEAKAYAAALDYDGPINTEQLNQRT